jgi:hypothetical protein
MRRLVHHVNQALRAALASSSTDKDYIVRKDEVVIIDEFTGRMMPGRRYSWKASIRRLEAKEHVAIQPENQTLASITFQNYFRLYDKLAGMTGAPRQPKPTNSWIFTPSTLSKFQPIWWFRVSTKMMKSIAPRKKNYRAIVAVIQSEQVRVDKGQPIRWLARPRLKNRKQLGRSFSF